MRKPSSPLRRALAVLLSLLILPWQQPAFALADSSVPGAVAPGVKLDKPREPLDLLDRKLDALLERIRNADEKAAASLPEDLVKLRGEYKAAQDGYAAAEKESPEDAKALLKPLLAESTGQLLAGAIVENDLGGIRKDLAALLARQASFGRPPAEIPAGDWAAIEKGVPELQAALTPLSVRVEKAKSQARLSVAEVEDGYRPLVAGLETAFQNLKASASRLRLADLLAAKPATVSGDAAGALMAEIAKALPKDKAAGLKPLLSEVNVKLAGYLRSGKPEDLQSAIGEIDRLYDQAQIKKADRAAMFERIGTAAQTQAQAGAAAAAAPKPSVLTSAGIKPTTDMDSLNKPIPLPVAEVERKADPVALVKSWLDEGRAAAGPAWEALLGQLPDAAAAPALLRDYALGALSGGTRTRAVALRAEDANEKAAKALAEAYALIERKVSEVVLEAPLRGPVPAGAGERAAYDAKGAKDSAALLARLKRIEAELKTAPKTALGATGAGVWGWSEALNALAPSAVAEADAKALAPARERARALVELVSSLREQHEKGALDLTNLEDADRRHLLYADGKGAAAGGPGAVGILGRAVIARTGEERKGVDSLKALGLTGDPASDAAKLNAFFDEAANRDAAEKGTLPPMLGDWGRARAFDLENAKLKGEGKPPLPRPPGLPGADEAYGRILVAERYAKIKAIREPTEKQMAELHETYFAMNRAAYVALGCDPAKLAAAEGRPESMLEGALNKGMTYLESAGAPAIPPVTVPAASATAEGEPPQAEAPEAYDPKKTAAFCAGFLKNARRPTSYNRAQFERQRALADGIKPFLEDNDLARASGKSAKASAAMLDAMRSMSPALREEYAKRGVDVDALLKQNDRAQALQWAGVVRQLSRPEDDAAWRSYRDGLISRYYGDETGAAVKAQADRLRAAASAGDAAGLSSSLAEIQNPMLLTSGYLAALPRMLASPRSAGSARDRALLSVWNGGVKKGEAPPATSYAGGLLAYARKYDDDAAKDAAGAAEWKRRAALLREVAADPSDPEKTAEALRSAGQLVFDERAVRVGLDTTKVAGQPGSEEERRDFLAAGGLALAFCEGGSFRTPECAGKIRRGLLAQLGGALANAQEENRRDQLILSSADMENDRREKLLKASTDMLAEGGSEAAAALASMSPKALAAFARRRMESGVSYVELLRMASLVKKNQDARLELLETTERLSATEGGRASMTLPGLLAAAKAESLQAFTGHAAPDGLVLSGWMIGIDARDVTMNRNRPKASASGGLDAASSAFVRGTAGNAKVPQGPPPAGRLDLISYVQKDGSTVYRTMDGSYNETHARKFERVVVGGREVVAAVSMGFNASGERVDVYTEGGKSFVVEKKGYHDAAGANRTSTERRAVTGVRDVVAVESVQIVTRENGRQAVSVIDKRGGETLSWTRFYAPENKGEAYDSVSMDLVAHTHTVVSGGRRTVFDLDKSNARLDDSRRRSTYEGGELARVEYFAKDETGRVAKAVVERPRPDLSKPGEAAVVEIRDYRLKSDAGDDVKRDGFGKQVTPNRIGRLGQAALDKAVLSGQLVEDARLDDRGGPRVDFRLTLNRDGKTNAELGAAYKKYGARLGAEMGLRQDDKTPMSGEFADRFGKLARFFDNQFVTADAAYAVTANVSRGGSVSMSGTRFDAAKMRDSSVDSGQFSFVALPKEAPKRQAGLPDKEQNGILLTQELWAVGQAAKDRFAFVTMDGKGGRDHVTGFFGSHNGVEKNHSFRADGYDENKTDGNGHWYHAADIIRDYYVDGVKSGKIVADETTSMWNGGNKLGTYTNNSIRYSDWGRRNPKTAAFVGGVTGGAIMTLLDPVMLGMMVIPMGAGYVAAKIGTGAFKAFKLIETGVNAYFMANIIVSTGEGVYKVAAGVVKDDANMINEGGMAVGSAVAMGLQMGAMKLFSGKGGTKETGAKETGVKETGVKETGVKETGAKETGTKETGTRDTGTRETGTRETGTRETGTRETGTRETGTRETGSRETGTRETGTRETGSRETGTRETGSRETGTRETGTRDSGGGSRPVEPSRGGRPVEGGRPPAMPVRPGPRVANAPFEGGTLDAPGRGGGGAELSPVGTKAASNAGSGGGGSASAGRAAEAPAAKPAVEKAPAAAEAAKAPSSPAPEPAPSKGSRPLPEAAAEAALPRPSAEAAPPLESVGAQAQAGPSMGEASMLVAEAGAGGRARPPLERGGPVERGPVERGPVERVPAERAPAERGRAERATEAEAGYDAPSPREAAFEPARRAPAEAAPSEAAAAKRAAEPPAAEAAARPAERAGTAPEAARANAEVQREANALVGEGAAPSAAPAPKPGIVKQGLARADSAFGAAMRPVGALWEAAAGAAARAGKARLPFTETPLSSVAGGTIRGLQTLGIGVEKFGARFGFLGSPLKSVGMMLQGRVLPHEGRPLTFEEVWHPDLAKRPSFLEAVPPEARALGGTVKGLFDPATGRASFGAKAKGSVEVAVEVRPDGKGGVEITDYRVKASEPALEARAHGEMYGQLERSFATEKHQAGLDAFFADKAVRARLAENVQLNGETFVDAVYDAAAGRFRLAEPGAGRARLRLESEASGALRLVEAEPLGEGARLPPAADYNLRLFSARTGVSLGEPAPAAAKPAPEELGARYAERLKADRVRVEREDVVRAALADARVEIARAKLDRTPSSGAREPALAKVRETARAVAELRVERETALTEMEAANRHLESLKIPKEAVARAERALAERERAGRDLEKAEAEFDAGVPGAAARGREAAARFRVADENASRAGSGLVDSAVDALVRRQAGSAKVASIEAAGRAARSELRAAAREALGGAQAPAQRRAAVAEALALERLAAAEAAVARDAAVREYRRDGLHRSTGGDGRRVAMMRMLAREGGLESGRAAVGQEAGKNLCVLATAADMAALKSGRPVEGAMAQAEAAIIAHHQAKAKAAGEPNWEAAGREAGEAFLRDAARTGMSAPEMREMMGAVAEASGLRLVEVKAEDLFVRLSQGEQVAVVMNHAADAAGRIGGGAHMVNLSNWRQARNAATGRVETMVDVADPNVRVLAGKDASGAPVYEARTVAMPLSQVVPELRGSLRGERGPAAGYAFEPAAGAGPRGPPDQAARLGASGEPFTAAAAAPVSKLPGFESRGPGRVLDPAHLPGDVWSPEIMAAAREHGIVFEAGPETLKRMKPGQDHNFVIVENPNGTIEMTVGRLAPGNAKEVGVKHVALGDGRAVLYSGSVRVDPATGRPSLDFNSGMYSRIGLDARWKPTPENARALAAHAEAILGTRVAIVDHFTGRPLDLGAGGQGVGSAQPLREISRGASRGEGWIVDGRPARRLSAGGFKEVLIHPANEALVIKLFTLTGAKDAAGSLAEKRLELRNMQPLLDIGRAPRVVEQGGLEFKSPSARMNAGYIVQERVVGRELGEMLRDGDPHVRNRALTEARALFEDLIAARVKLEDRVKMHENISVGRAGGAGHEKAWVLDAGEATRVAKPGFLDGLLGRPDPLRVYYEGVLAELSGLSRGAPRGAERVQGVGSAPDPAPYERYFSAAEIRAAHPEPPSGGVYHDWQHTVKVADMAGEFARARGLGEAQAKFVSEVALLHDFDATRAPGKPARVLSTLADLRADFAGTRSLNGEPGRSVLKERFGWSEGQLKMAEAMIQRTEFPFAEKHPNPAYADKSPLARYTEMLEGLPPGDRRFVLREAPLLSEYADKSSWYATEDFAGAFKAVEGLVKEIGVPSVTVGTLGTNGFLKVVGEPAAFAHDAALAGRFGVELKLPNRAEAFKLLPERYGRAFESNLKGFTEFDAAAKAGEPAAGAFERASAIADAALAPARPQGVGSAREALPDSPAAARLRAEQSFARTPDYPNSPVFAENSRKANDFFNRWLDGREGSVNLRGAMESMHELYAGKGEIGKGMGGQYMADGAPSNSRAAVTRDFVRDSFGLEPNRDGHVELPGIPREMSPMFLGNRYFYPDSSVPGMRETYYRVLEARLTTYAELVNRIEARKAADARFDGSAEHRALVRETLDVVVDFGRTAAAFRQFKNGNWGLYGPMMNSMVNRLGFQIRSPGYLDIILQGATEKSIKPFFEKSLREGAEFYTKDGYDPTKGKPRAPPEIPAVPAAPSARAVAGPLEVRANAPAVVKYEGPIRLRIGGEFGKTLEILSRADLSKRFPGVERSLVDPRIDHVLIDPSDPSQLKGLRPGQSFELGRASPGRFDLMQQVSGRHVRVTGNGATLTIEDLGSRNGTVIEPVAARAPAAVRVEGVGSDGLFGRLFGAREKAPAAPERIVWPVEAGGPAPARLDAGALKLDGPLKNLEAVHSNVLAVELAGRKAVLKVDAKPNEARVLAAMADVPLPANVRVPRLLGEAPADAMVIHRLFEGTPGAADYAAVKRAAAEGRSMIAVERLPDDFVSMLQVTNGSVKLKEPISRADWQGLLDAVKALSRRGMGFGDLGNETNIRLRQVADGKGGVRTEFALIDAGQGTLKGKVETLASDYVQLKGDRALETRLLERRLLRERGELPDPRLAAMARNQVPQSQALVTELSALMKDGGARTPSASRGESRRFTDLAQAAAYLKAPEGIAILAKTSEGLAGDTVKVEVAGEDWYLKRVSKKLGSSMDDGLRGLTPAERAGNELALREVVRRWFPETYGVAPEAISIEHGGEIFVMTKGAAAAPAPERLQMMTAAEHADYALLRLVFRAEDLNRGNVLFGKDGKPTLIDFEKVIAEPLQPDAVARGAANELLVKGFPVVSMKGNDMAVYRARAETLRARLADPTRVAELSGILERAGWSAERSAAYLKAVEVNLRNFETNLAPYVAEANRIIGRRLEGVGAADNLFEGPPDAVRARQPSDKPSPLRQMQISLESRGQGEVFKQAEAILYTDGLTGLPNRAFIMEKAEALLSGVKEPTVAMLDMNNFGAVNAGLADVHGPVTGKELGDGMLADAGPKISALARKMGVHVARLGGEEIVVFGSQNQVIDFAAAMRKRFPPEQVLRDARIAPGGKEHKAIDAAMTRLQRTGPVGDFTYGLARTEGRGFDAALKAADGVLNKAKAEGLRGEAVMETPGAGVSFTRLREISALAQQAAKADLGPLAARPDRVAEIQALKAKLTGKEYAVFLEAVFKDPLTLTKTAEWIDMSKAQWEAAYEGRGGVAMISARNFKAVNDILGHAAGDLYLRRLGVIMRVEVNRLKKLGYSVEDPVRVAGKEFLLVGKDAAKVAELVSSKFVEKLNAGQVLPGEQLERLRVEAVERGFIPKERASRMGDLRAVDEPFKGGFKKTYERVILELEALKVREERAAAAADRPKGVGSEFEDLPGFLRKGAVEPAKPLDPAALREFGRLAAAHYAEPWNGDRRADGIRASHVERLFRPALIRAHGATTLELPVPGFPGMTYVRYRLYQSDGRGNFLTDFKADVFEKTLVDEKLWSEARLAELAGAVFGGVKADGRHFVTHRGVNFVGHVRDGKLQTFGVDSWEGQPPLSEVPAARAPASK